MRRDCWALAPDRKAVIGFQSREKRVKTGLAITRLNTLSYCYRITSSACSIKESNPWLDFLNASWAAGVESPS